MKLFLQLFVLVLMLTGLVMADAQGTMAAALEESFEDSFPPSGWSEFSDGFSWDGWQQSSDKSKSGSKSAVAETQFVYATDIWLVTPAVDLSTAPSAKLYFYEDQSSWEGSGGTNSIAVSTTSASSSSSFTTILEMTPANHVITGFGGNMVEVDLSAYVGQSTVYIAFHYYNPASPNYSWFIDDVKVVIPSDHDVMAYSLDMLPHYDPSTVVQPTATVRNEGLNTETFDVQFGRYDWNDNEVILDTKTVTSLVAGASTLVTFDDYTFERVGYTFFTKTALSGDMDTGNDLVTKFVNSYVDQKDVVAVEKFTDINCGYCPGAAKALDSLHHDYPDNIAIVAHHGGYSDTDPYDNHYAEDRRSYYTSLGGYPTTYFGGDNIVVGGSLHDGDWVSYPYYDMEAAFLAERAEYTPLTMSLRWTENGEEITATATVTYEGITLAKDDHLRWALNESHIAYNWQTSMDSLHFVQRFMPNEAQGTKMWNGSSAPAVGTEFESVVQFTIADTIVKENTELIAFVQDDDTKEVRVAAKVDLGNEPSAIGDANDMIVPTEFALEHNYPNPFNPTTAISYQLSAVSQVKLTVYNALGQKVRTLVNEKQNAGTYSVNFNATGLASGIYLYRLSAGNFVQMRKMVLMK